MKTSSSLPQKSFAVITRNTIQVVALISVAACGGGGTGESKTASPQSATCSQFIYQQQAQAYMVQFEATQLDADHDGIACEALPRAKSSSGTRIAASYPAASTFITTIGSTASFSRTSDFSLDATWRFLSILDSYDYFALAQGDSAEISFGYNGTRVKMQFAQVAQNATLLGFGEWPGFSGIYADGIGVELPEILNSPIDLPVGDYLYLSQTCVSIECESSKGTLRISGGKLLACPDSTVVTSSCLNAIKASFEKGGPVWKSDDELGMTLIAANGMIAYRRCSGALSSHSCTVVFGIPVSDSRTEFRPPAKSIGRDGYNLKVIQPAVSPTNIRSSTIPGIFSIRTGNAYMLQNRAGDYITYDVGFGFTLHAD